MIPQDAGLDTIFFMVMGEIKFFNQLEHMRTSKGPSGTAKRERKNRAKRVIFKGDGSLDTLFSRLLETLKLFLTSDMSGYLREPIRDIEDFKGNVMNVNNGQKESK